MRHTKDLHMLLAFQFQPPQPSLPSWCTAAHTWDHQPDQNTIYWHCLFNTYPVLSLHIGNNYVDLTGNLTTTYNHVNTLYVHCSMYVCNILYNIGQRKMHTTRCCTTYLSSSFCQSFLEFKFFVIIWKDKNPM